VGVPDSDADGAVDGLTDGVSELAVGVGLAVVGLTVGDVVTVAVAVVVTWVVWVAVAVVVAVTIEVAVTEALTAGVAGVEAPDVGRVDALVDGATDGVCERAGTLGELAVGSPTEGPLAVLLGAVDEGAGRPLLLTVGDTGGNVADRLGAAEPSPVCAQPARANPATAASTSLWTRIIGCSWAWLPRLCWHESISFDGQDALPVEPRRA